MAEDHHVEYLATLLKSLKSRSVTDESLVVLDSVDSDPTAVTKALRSAPPSKVTAKNVFRHGEAHPLVLDLLLIDKYGEEWLGWESETIEHRVPLDFGVDRVSDLNLAKINAMKTLHLVDSFWERWEVFVWCTMSINSIFPDFRQMQVPTVFQSMVAVDIANRVRADMEWSSEIVHYLGVVHRHDGILVPQPPVAFAEVDTVGLPIDINDVVTRWPSIRASREEPGAETPEDEQLRRMLTVYLLLENKRVQLRQQLEVLRG